MTRAVTWYASGTESVLGRLEVRTAQASSPTHESTHATRDLRLAARSRPWELGDTSTSGPSVIAFLFALPGSAAIRAIDAAGDYFAVRTGDAWDLFLPGYAQEDRKTPRGERLGTRRAARMTFVPDAFDTLRDHVETASGRRWRYSGGSDLVLVNTWLSPGSAPVIDWQSTASGSLTEAAAGRVSLGIAEVIERISRDLQQNLEDPHYGVSKIMEIDHRRAPAASSIIRDLFVGVTSEIVASFAAKTAGL